MGFGKTKGFPCRPRGRGHDPGPPRLDTCCGLGTNGLYLAEKGFEVTGIDISEKAVEIAERRSKEKGNATRTNFYARNFMDMDFAPGSLDFVLDVGCFHHVSPDDRLPFIENIHRVLSPGGRYLLMCFSDRMGPSWNHFSGQQVRDFFSRHFNILILKEISSIEGDDAIRYFHPSLMERNSDGLNGYCAFQIQHGLACNTNTLPAVFTKQLASPF